MLQKLVTEKQVNQPSGTMDTIWLNGENFKNAKANKLLVGSFTNNLPNYQVYIDGTQFEFDLGTKVDGLEAPWGKVHLYLIMTMKST
ncbi:hypothetical protein KHA80_22780 [Anaerobacillus sp. HL2]|nr:hypothetical protein KHA80_22780 [Anaerobacillus sp. HL2]